MSKLMLMMGLLNALLEPGPPFVLYRHLLLQALDDSAIDRVTRKRITDFDRTDPDSRHRLIEDLTQRIMETTG